MSQAESVYLQFRRDEHINRIQEAKERLAEQRGVDVEDLSRIDVVATALRVYNEAATLRADKRVEETIEVIADDHSVDPADVGLECAFKVAAGAYTGYQQTSDWEIKKNGEKA